MRVSLTIFAAVVSGVAYASGAHAAEASAICHQLNLSPTAEGDCEQQMGSALTDADRAKVIHTFATGLANTRADALIGQLSSTAPAAAPASPVSAAAKAGAQTSPTAPAEGVAVPQQKAAASGGAGRSGTKAKPQPTQMAPRDQPLAKTKGEKTSHQLPPKPAKKGGH